MRHRIITFLVILLVVASSPAQQAFTINDSATVTMTQLIGTELPLMVITTVGGEEPTCDYVTAPAGAWGKSITNATKVPGRLQIYNGEATPAYDSGEYDNRSGGMTIKIRGNTSAYSDKKPYKIKLASSADLMFRDDPLMLERDWLLVSDGFLNTLSGHALSRVVGMTWTPASMYVNVVLNGNYRGIYLLIESVKRSPGSRLDVSRSGMVCEGDAYWWNADVYVKSILDSHYGYTFKYPDEDDITEADLQYFKTYLNAFEKSQSQADYADYIDLQSFARWCLAEDILGAWDSGGANRYYMRHNRQPESRMVMPCLWDFSSNESMLGSWSRCHTEHFSRLFDNNNPAFRLEYIKTWLSLCPTLQADAQAALDSFAESRQFKGLRNSAGLNEQRWGTRLDFDELLSKRKQWYGKRLPILARLIDGLRVRGDANVDGTADIADVNSAINCMLGKAAWGENSAACDINVDHVVDMTDVNIIINAMLGR